jgi:MFS family permease
MGGGSRSGAGRAILIAWLITAVYYFFQYVLRSAPAVMMPQLSAGFGISAAAVASLLGLFYYGYSPFSLVGGVAMDRLGPRLVVPVGAFAVGAGALLFASGSSTLAGIGRFFQGAGGVFALLGAIYIATKHLPASRAATLIGATQMFGMAGGSAGQFIVGPLIAGGLAWKPLLGRHGCRDDPPRNPAGLHDPERGSPAAERLVGRATRCRRSDSSSATPSRSSAASLRA